MFWSCMGTVILHTFEVHPGKHFLSSCSGNFIFSSAMNSDVMEYRSCLEKNLMPIIPSSGNGESSGMM